MLSSFITSLRRGASLASEQTRWGAANATRRWEIHQLKSRLAEEYQRLGQEVAKKTPDDEKNDAQEKNLCLRQIDFLREEIAYLEKELQRVREEHLQKHDEI